MTIVLRDAAYVPSKVFAAIAISIGRACDTVQAARAVLPAARASDTIETAPAADVEDNITVVPAGTLVCRWSATTRSFSWQSSPLQSSEFDDSRRSA